MDELMNRRAIVATDHKTGTVWMAETFRAISAKMGIPFERFRKDQPGAADTEPPVIIHDTHSRWYAETEARQRRPEDRLVHLIRDPRDVVISAAHYHCTSKEKWLHAPSGKFGGRTYSQSIAGLPNHRARYLFEMENSASKVIQRMTQWNYARSECLECKYEDLIQDTDASLFTKVVAHLGFSAPQVETCKVIFLERAIFDGRSKPLDVKTKHIRSGAPRQWASVFDQKVGRAFADRFGNALIALGYERDNSWAERLPATVTALD